MALSLSDAFGNQPYIWLGLQQQFDLWPASREKRPKIQKFPRAA
jgi:plasmid maintenance system antidote protein VapI